VGVGLFTWELLDLEPESCVKGLGFRVQGLGFRV
jgi:hypothetical protein